MERRLSKRVPIAAGIVYIAFVALSYLATMVFTILQPQLYVRMVTEGWQITLLGSVLCAVSALFMAVIYTLSKKADLKWLKIVSLVHMLADSVGAVLFGIISLTYL